MKRLFYSLYIILWLLFGFLPGGRLIAGACDYDFQLISYPAYAVVTAAVALGAAILSFHVPKEENKVFSVFITLSVPFSLIHSVFYEGIFMNEVITVSLVLCVLCCSVSALKWGGPFWLKSAGFLLSGILVLIFCFTAFLNSLFGGLSSEEIVRVVESPDGADVAAVVEHNQGALGGNTHVDLYENKLFHGGFFTVSKKPTRIYTGSWGEFDTMEIYWKSEDCLVINSVEYEVKS